MQKWMFLAVLTLGLMMVVMHLGVSVALYYGAAEVKVEVTNTESLAQHVIKAMSSEDMREQLTEAWAGAFQELAGELTARVEHFEEELGEAFGEAASTGTGRSPDASSRAQNDDQSPTMPGRLDLERAYELTPEDVNEERVRSLLGDAIRDGSLSKLECHPGRGQPTIRVAGKKLATEQVGEPVVAAISSDRVWRPVCAPTGELKPFCITAKRIYRWPTWLVVYAVAGCTLISLGTGAISIAVLKCSSQ